jgi:hypothetical protein
MHWLQADLDIKVAQYRWKVQISCDITKKVKSVNYLQPALDQIKGRDSRMRDATGQHAAQRTQGVELGGAEFAAVFIARSGRQLSTRSQLGPTRLLSLRIK